MIEALPGAGQPAGPRHAGPQLPAQLALQGAVDLPRHGAVVHPDGGRRPPARQGAGRDRRHPLGAGARPQPHPRHDRDPPRLVRLAPARLGRADRGVRAQGDRRGAARPRGGRADGAARSRRRVPTRGGLRDPQEFLGNGLCRRRLREGRRHPRCLVRQRLHPRHRAGAAARAEMAGLALPRGLRPASRLVPLLAAGELRHARPRTLRRRADPRLRGRRRRPQDVQVAGQRRLADRPDEDPRCRHPAPVGGQRRLHRGSAHRQRRSWTGSPTPIAACATRCATCWATSPASATPSGSTRRRCPSSIAGCCTGWPSSTSRCAAATHEFDFPRLYGQLHNFCGGDLSAFYFDVRKDALYCDPPDSIRRRAARTVLDELFRCLTAWLAPVLVFTAEEAWLTRYPDAAQRASGAVPDDPRQLARRRRWASAGSASARCAGSSPARSSSSARRSGSAPACRRHPTVYLGEADRQLLAGPRSGRARDHQRHRAGGPARPRLTPSRSRTCRASP